MLRPVGVLPVAAFEEVRCGSFCYVGAAIGLGAVTNESGLGELLGRMLQSSLNIHAGADFVNFMVLSLFATVVGMVTTNPAAPAVVAVTMAAAAYAGVPSWANNA